MADPKKGLSSLSLELAHRLDVLTKSGYPNILMHNRAGEELITPIALFVDEIAELDDATKELIKGMVKLYRASGLYPILATNDPTQSSILMKTNLSTRICFRVPSWNDSMTVLGAKGAEDLPQAERDKPGRGMIVWHGRLTQFMPYVITWPTPSEDARRQLADHLSELAQPNTAAADADSERILALATAGKNEAAIIREVWGITGGGSFYKRQAQVREILSKKGTSSSSNPPFGLQNGLEVA